MIKLKSSVLVTIGISLLVGLFVGFVFGTYHKNVNSTLLQFNQNDVYSILVEMKKSENDRCGGPCSKSVDYIRAMNANYAVVESKGIDGPGAFYIYKKNNEAWEYVRGGQENPPKEWLQTQGIPESWFYN